MSLNLAKINRALTKDKRLYSATHLLSMSFDPEHDTPSVLKSYGTDSGAKTDPEFRHWEFDVIPSSELRAGNAILRSELLGRWRSNRTLDEHNAGVG
jgi:cytochrome oxidase Cu insertion factor (SCO1/SenC/PrrC family)